jgi:hypothetical protein
MTNATKAIAQIVFCVTVALVGILFRKSIKRIYSATVKPVVTKTVEAFRVGL